jgi:hypothetical protein
LNSEVAAVMMADRFIALHRSQGSYQGRLGCPTTARHGCVQAPRAALEATCVSAVVLLAGAPRHLPAVSMPARSGC